ncbi:MAG: T9SS type A sorting domain-containing protein [Ignavibacterium sp.]|jgi:probable HAF family extracellular repeat protein|nr:T9SS type A sorting domain-containing protein [Ignavibacterium sp.]
MKFKALINFTLILSITAMTKVNAQSLTWLGTLGGDESIAYAVSNDGSVIVGKGKDSNDENRAFRWISAGGIQYLSGAQNIRSWANAISVDGSVIVGTTQDQFGIRKAFKWTEQSSLEYLAPLSGTNFNESEAFDINSDGTNIVGQLRNTLDEVRGFIWNENSGMTELSALFYRGDYCIVNAISGNSNRLVGWSSDTVNNYAQIPVEWESNYIINTMPIPPGSGNGVAEEISENGEYAVGRILINGYMHGYRWHRQQPGFWESAIDLGLLPGNTNPSAICYALDVSNDGEVVGLTTGSSPDGSVAFLWERINPTLDIMHDLNVLYSNLINQSGYLLQANAITPDGRFIVGKGYRPSLSRYEAYLLDRGTTTSVREIDALPNNFSLEQNYPNPFNPSTKIRYSIPNVTLSGVEGSRVQLKVYDLLGNEVATLVNEEKPSGVYEVDFNASNLSSGIYFYKLTAGAFTQTKKMTVLK